MISVNTSIALLLQLFLVVVSGSKRPGRLTSTPSFLSLRLNRLGISSTQAQVLQIRGGDIQTITSLSEIQTIIDSASQTKQMVVLDFKSNNCPPCEMIAPIYEDLSNLDEFANVIFCKVNVSYQPEVAAHYGVDGWPTFMLFNDGKVVDSIVGGQAAKAGLYGLVAKHAK